MSKVPFFVHNVGDEELEEIRKVFLGRILTTGDTVKEFEQKFARYLGRGHTLAVNSCTGALHLSLMALGIGKGDEVITTPLTFIATATAIIEAGATPIFVDVENDTGNMDARLIEQAITSKTRAILPVHLYGQMCDMRAIKKIADQYELHVIEDCAHCVEGERDGIKPGELSDTACFSFFATKNITCGEGGALVTDNEILLKKIKLLSLHGMNKTSNDRFKEGYQHWDMLSMGWKYNLSNIQAAMLLPQLKRVDINLEIRRALYEAYCKNLRGIPSVEIVSVKESTRHAHHLLVVRIKNNLRDKVIESLLNEGIEVVVNYRAIHLLSYFRDVLEYKQGDYPVAEKIGDEVISLPFYPGMSESMTKVVTDAIKKLKCLEAN